MSFLDYGKLYSEQKKVVESYSKFFFTKWLDDLNLVPFLPELQRNDLKNKIYNNRNFFVRIYSVMIILTAKLAQCIYTMYIIFSSINDASNVNCLRIV